MAKLDHMIPYTTVHVQKPIFESIPLGNHGPAKTKLCFEVKTHVKGHCAEYYLDNFVCLFTLLPHVL